MMGGGTGRSAVKWPIPLNPGLLQGFHFGGCPGSEEHEGDDSDSQVIRSYIPAAAGQTGRTFALPSRRKSPFPKKQSVQMEFPLHVLAVSKVS